MEVPLQIPILIWTIPAIVFSQHQLFSIQLGTLIPVLSIILSHTLSFVSVYSLHPLSRNFMWGKEYLLHKPWLIGSLQHQCHCTEHIVPQLWSPYHFGDLTCVSSYHKTWLKTCHLSSLVSICCHFIMSKTSTRWSCLSYWTQCTGGLEHGQLSGLSRQNHPSNLLLSLTKYVYEVSRQVSPFWHISLCRHWCKV